MIALEIFATHNVGHTGPPGEFGKEVVLIVETHSEQPLHVETMPAVTIVLLAVVDNVIIAFQSFGHIDMLFEAESDVELRTGENREGNIVGEVKPIACDQRDAETHVAQRTVDNGIFSIYNNIGNTDGIVEETETETEVRRAVDRNVIESTD